MATECQIVGQEKTCTKCGLPNIVLGASKDNPKLLQGAVAYLEQWRSSLT